MCAGFVNWAKNRVLGWWCAFPHVTQSGKNQQQVNTCDSHQFPGKYIKGRRIVCQTKRILNCNQLFWNFFPTKTVYSAAASNNKRTITFKHCHCSSFGCDVNIVSISISESHLQCPPSHQAVGWCFSISQLPLNYVDARWNLGVRLPSGVCIWITWQWVLSSDASGWAWWGEGAWHHEAGSARGSWRSQRWRFSSAEPPGRALRTSVCSLMTQPLRRWPSETLLMHQYLKKETMRFSLGASTYGWQSACHMKRGH